MTTPQDSNLISLVLLVRPLKQTENKLPIWWGSAAHNLLLQTIKTADESLAKTYHDEQSIRPFSVSTLMGRFPERKFSDDFTYLLRFTGINKEVTKILYNAHQPNGLLAPGSIIELDHLNFQIENAFCDHEAHSFADTSSYPELVSRSMLSSQPPANDICFQFNSPTYFSSEKTQSPRNKQFPFPLPDLIFGSLLDRWNAFGLLAFPPELRKYAAECLLIKRFDLKSRRIPVVGGIQIGMVGKVVFVTSNYDRYWMSLLHVLADYAFYSGVGAKIAFGLGQAQKVEGRKLEQDRTFIT
ncbi:MAG: CRISPR system precrRNA processing endoribonuclease RAMP protein Cas6 [Anaerolineaceae bacterium]|nr:CRISPR system precrRNA processing endoribonuclease RAMP protein Cas6 [Anaerolineaceae bacterium]